MLLHPADRFSRKWHFFLWCRNSTRGNTPEIRGGHDGSSFHCLFDFLIPLVASVDTSICPNFEKPGLLKRLELSHQRPKQVFIFMAVADETVGADMTYFSFHLTQTTESTL